MTTPRSGDSKTSASAEAKSQKTADQKTADKASAAQTARDKNTDGASNTETFQGTPTEAARSYLHAPGDVAPLGMVLGDDVMEAWAAQVKADDRYRTPDPDNPADDTAATNSSGSNPPPALIVQYGPGQNDYISTVFDAGQVIVQNGADPTGKAWKYPESSWRRFVAAVRGEPIPVDPRAFGPTQYEEAALLNERTGKALQADRDANQAARERADETPR